MIDIVIPVRDFYRNIPGKGKVRELTKGKQYECGIETFKVFYKSFYLRTDLGDMKMYSKKSMFITKAKSRDNKIKQILK
jgi:hypothetical protein